MGKRRDLMLRIDRGEKADMQARRLLSHEEYQLLHAGPFIRGSVMWERRERLRQLLGNGCLSFGRL